MIKRSNRNLGKIVRIDHPNHLCHGRRAKVVGFRGDFDKGDPYVQIFLYNLCNNGGSVIPIPGSFLKEEKEEK